MSTPQSDRTPDGADTPVVFYYTDGFRGDRLNSDTPLSFGHNASMTTVEVDNQASRVYLPATRTAVDIRPGTVQGTWAISAELSTTEWLGSIRGSPTTTDNGDGSYTHTYNGTPHPIEILEGDTELDETRVLEGGIATNATVSPSTDGEGGTEVTIEGLFAKESRETGTPTQPSISERPLDAKDALYTLNGTEQVVMLNASLQMPWTNAQLRYGFTSRFAQTYQVGNFEPTLSATRLRFNSDWRDNVYGGSTTSMQEEMDPNLGLELSFDNGLTGGDANEILFIGDEGFANTYSEDGVGNPQDAIQENADNLVQDIEIQVTNGNAEAAL